MKKHCSLRVPLLLVDEPYCADEILLVDDYVDPVTKRRLLVDLVDEFGNLPMRYDDWPKDLQSYLQSTKNECDNEYEHSENLFFTFVLNGMSPDLAASFAMGEYVSIVQNRKSHVVSVRLFSPDWDATINGRQLHADLLHDWETQIGTTMETLRVYDMHEKMWHENLEMPRFFEIVRARRLLGILKK